MSKNLPLGIALVVVGAISIGLSSYLYRIDEGEGKIAGASLCDSSPFEYARPFYIHNKDGGDDLFCGYSMANTVYRIILAGLTIIFGFAYLPGLIDTWNKFNYNITYYLAVGWFCATTADCTAIYMSRGVCTNFFNGSNAEFYHVSNVYECHSERYGLAVAFDFLMSVILLYSLFTSADEPKET